MSVGRVVRVEDLVNPPKTELQTGPNFIIIWPIP